MTFILIVISFLLLTFFLIYIAYSLYSDFKGAPFVPSNKKAVEDMIRMADIKDGEKLIDLGSGDGRIVFEATKKNIEAYGIDVNLVLIVWSLFIKFVTGNKKAHFKLKDIFKEDLSQYDVITLYCLPRTIGKLEEKLRREMKIGARIVSNTFVLNNAKLIKEEGKIKVYRL